MSVDDIILIVVVVVVVVVVYKYYYKCGQVTKPIILVKICYKLLYVIQGVKNTFIS